MLNPMNIRFETNALKTLLEIWPHPKTGKKGMTPYALSKAASVSEQTIHNHLDENYGRKPSVDFLESLQLFFKVVYFTIDPSRSLDNEGTLKKLEEFLDTYVFKNSSDKQNTTI